MNMTEYQTKKIGDVAVKITKGTTPTTFGRAFTDEGVNFIKVESISDDGRLLEDKFSHIDEDTHSVLQRSMLEADDVLFSIAGAIGRTAIVTPDVLPANINQAVALIRPNTSLISPKFLALFLQEEKLVRFANSIVAQSVQANINLQQLGNLEVPVPTLSEQKDIVDVLSSLNDKIAFLRTQNDTLEQISQTIFNETFIKKSADDKLPSGWRTVKVQDVADVTIGRTPPRKEREWFSLNPNHNKWISIKDLGGCGAYIETSSEYLTPEAVARFRVPLIQKGTVVVSFKLTVGRVAIAAENMYSNEAIAHIKTSKLPTEYVYLFFKNFDYNSLGSTSSIATATNSETIRQINILLPDDTTLAEFTRTVSPLFQKILTNTRDIKTLAATRDLLLPRLMNGEIKV